MKLPKCNGRPQLWTRCGYEGIRIIWPNGKVSWTSIYDGEFIKTGTMIENGCTTGLSQEEAILNCIFYETTHWYQDPVSDTAVKAPPKFLGYL
jgi:hypothetical protein